MITIISPENLYKEYAKTHSELEALEDCYQNYDSRLVKEDLNFSGLCAFFHKNITVPGWFASYTLDETGIATSIISLSKRVYRSSVITKGYIVVRNLKGSYDIHEFWHL